jgi:hypothetical protein
MADEIMLTDLHMIIAWSLWKVTVLPYAIFITELPVVFVNLATSHTFCFNFVAS